MSRGVPVDRPLTYAGPYDPDRTYLPREIVTLDGVPYMATALMQGVEPVPPVAPGGGAAGLLGYAELYFTFSTTTDCDDSANYADYSLIMASSGSPGIAVDGAGQWDYNTDSVDSIYITTATIDPVTAGGLPAASDVTSFWADCGLTVGTSAVVGDTWQRMETTGIYRLTGIPITGVLPRIKATCTDPTITFQATAVLYVARFPAP